LPDKVSSAEKTQRSKRLITLSERKALDFNKMNIGQITNVLFEKSPAEGNITGFSSNYIKVEYPWQAKLAGQLKRVKFNTISSSGRMRVELIG
jgi:threonylcarbamoyladenosine tRNA methylthiotransferase MtaB